MMVPSLRKEVVQSNMSNDGCSDCSFNSTREVADC
jgi:hypothetical protein